MPSATPVVFQVAGAGSQVTPPSGEISKVVVTMPEAFAPPGSLVPAGFVASVTVACRFAPGSTIWAIGAVLSTRRLVTATPLLWLPATS